MKAIYLGNIYEPEGYEVLSLQKKAFTNPSGQNYHALLAKVIGSLLPTLVISFLKNPHIDYKKPVISVSYLSENERNPLTLIQKAVSKALQFAENDKLLVFFDALNIKAAKAAKILRAKHLCKTVAVITDKASNISGTPLFYSHQIKSLLYYANGFITVTKGLNDFYNDKRKPSLIVPGILGSARHKPNKFEEGSYIFYGGALNERFGALNLINAFKELSSVYSLVLVGHHADKKIEEAINGNRKIHYLKQVSPLEYHTLASQSALNVNPRPYDRKLDPYCVPSKLVQFLSLEPPILSSQCSPLREKFEDDVNWIGDVSEEGIRLFLQKHIGKKGTFVRLKQNYGQSKIRRLCGQSNVKEGLQSFLANFDSTFSSSSMSLENSK